MRSSAPGFCHLKTTKHSLTQPLWLSSLLKFDGSDKTYDLYRDEAGKLVMKDGGGLAFLGNVVVRMHACAAWRQEKGSSRGTPHIVQGAGPGTFDEVMVVAYKHRFQFFKMALLTPSYWPLSFLRDEGLTDGMLHATTPVALRHKE